LIEKVIIYFSESSEFIESIRLADWWIRLLADCVDCCTVQLLHCSIVRLMACSIVGLQMHSYTAEEFYLDIANTIKSTLNWPLASYGKLFTIFFEAAFSAELCSLRCIKKSCVFFPSCFNLFPDN
jgi:hypothetical protein